MKTAANKLPRSGPETFFFVTPHPTPVDAEELTREGGLGRARGNSLTSAFSGQLEAKPCLFFLKDSLVAFNRFLPPPCHKVVGPGAKTGANQGTRREASSVALIRKHLLTFI